MTSVVRIRAIGRTEIQLGSCRIGPESAVLFALVLYLACNASVCVSRARLLELLWPGVPEASRRHALRQLLYRLRHKGLDIALEGGGLLLDRAFVDSDLADVLSSGWPETAGAEDVVRAGTLLPGYAPALSEQYLRWLDELRERVEPQYRKAVLRHLAQAQHEGRWVDVTEWARRCLATDSLNEEATLASAEALAMCGSKTRALDVIEEYRGELGDREKTIGLPARVLTRRISEQHARRPQETASINCIGREAETARLNELLALAGTKHRVAALVVGPAGIGKSTVTQQLVDSAHMRGWRSISIRLQASDAHRPLAAFVDLFSELLRLPGALGGAPASLVQLQQLTQHDVEASTGPPRSHEAEAVQERIRTAAVDVLGAVCEESPLVLLLEDLHWIDKPSTRLLLHLLERTSSLPVFWLLTARGEVSYVALRTALPEELAETIRLGPLRASDAVGLFRSLVDRTPATDDAWLTEFAEALTGGNPFFIREVARHYTETRNATSIPSSLRAIIHDRVARLSPLSRSVVHTCAILGRYASVPRLASVLDIGTTELLGCLEELDALGILGTGRPSEALAMHDLWQEELLSSMVPASKQLIHHRCGAVLESEARHTRSASMVWETARHLIASGVSDRALSLLEECAQHQMENGLPVDAAATFARAYDAATSDTDRFRTMSGRIAALHRGAKWSELAEVIGPAIVLSAICTPSDTEHSELELLQSECLWRTEKDSLGCLERAVSCVLDQNAPDGHRAGAGLLAGFSAANLARWEVLERVHYLVGSLRCETVEDRARVLCVQTIFHTALGSLDQGLLHAEHLISLEQTIGSVGGLHRAFRFAAHTLVSLGKNERAVALLKASHELALEYKLPHEACSAADILATLHVERNDVPGAELWIKRAQRWAGQISADYARNSLNCVRAMVALASDRPEYAASIVDRNVDVVSKDPLVRKRVANLSILARISVGCKELDRLGDTVRELRHGLEQIIMTCRNDYFVGSLALGLKALGREEEACRYTRRYLTHTRRDRSVALPDLLTFSRN